jgi:hypothetical protein
MSDPSLWTPPRTKSIPLRPLSKGMRRDIDENVMAVGEFYDLRNLQATTNGLRRRRALSLYLAGVSHPPVTSLDLTWKSDGTQFATLLDSKMLYTVGISSYSLVKYVYSTGTVTGAVTGGVTRLAGAGTLWATAASDVKVGDVVYCANLTGTTKLGVIKSINSDTQLDLNTNEGTASAGSSYEIRRAIWGRSGHYPDLTSINGSLVIVDGRRKPRSFVPGSSTTLYGYYSADGTFDLYPCSVLYWKDRLWFGRIFETSGTLDCRNRVRWTTTLDLTKLPALQFVDIPYSDGYIRRLMGLGNNLLSYFDDAVYVGRQTGFGDALPVAFDTKLDTGGVGLAGDRALLSALGGHFWVGQDNIYYQSASLSPFETIADPIKDLFFEDPSSLANCRIELDVLQKRLLFTEPSESQSFTKIFVFDYQAKSWSYEEIDGTYLGKKQIMRGYTYDAWLTSGPYTYDTGLGVFPSYDSIGGSDTSRVYVGFGDALRYYADATVTRDLGVSAIPVRIESGDFDYNEPDDERIHLRLSVKLKKALLNDLSFNVFVSDDEGLGWREITASGRLLVIKAGTKENFVTFRSKGSTFRFKLESSSTVEEYTVKEIVLLAAGAGVESHLAANR